MNDYTCLWHISVCGDPNIDEAYVIGLISAKMTAVSKKGKKEIHENNQ